MTALTASQARLDGKYEQPRLRHVSVCICTYRRPALLRRLLDGLGRQETGNTFTFAIIVADNDHAASGRLIVEDFAATSPIPIEYHVEPRRNISHARNCAIAHAQGHFIAWIDDDEFPAPGWLGFLVATVDRYGVAGVLGSVRPHFDFPPPRWLVAGRFCERREHPTGTVMHWRNSFVGNSLLRLDFVRQQRTPFRAEFGLGGEDVDFFRRMTAQGHRFVWCNEAVVYEVVPPNRWTRSYRLKRAMLLGRSTLRLGGVAAVTKSVVAIPVYLVLVPLTVFFGQHVFMRYCIKLSAHLGRLLSCCGLNPISERPE